MGAVLAITAVVIALGILAWFLVSSGVIAKSSSEGEVEVGAEPGERRHALRYAVPAGQDPAVVLAALSHHGIHAEPEDHAEGLPYVVVPRPDGVADEAVWREEVRSAIETADTSMLDPAHVSLPVRFVDEQHA